MGLTTEQLSVGRREIRHVVDIIQCDPLDYASEIIDLFQDEGRVGFEEFFHRAYPIASINGGRSWIGADSKGTVVLHASCFPHTITYKGVEYTAGIVSNVLARPDYRTFFPSRALLHRLASDCFSSGRYDILYCVSATAANVLRNAGFVTVGSVHRLIRPLNEEGFRRLLGRTADRVLSLIQHFTADCSVEVVGSSHSSEVGFSNLAQPSDQLVGRHGLTVYQQRLAGYPDSRYSWYTASLTGRPVSSLALTQEADDSGVAKVIYFTSSDRRSALDLIQKIAIDMKMSGARALQIAAMSRGETARMLRRIGFWRREGKPLLALALNKKGARLVSQPRIWNVGQLDIDS